LWTLLAWHTHPGWYRNFYLLQPSYLASVSFRKESSPLASWGKFFWWFLNKQLLKYICDSWKFLTKTYIVR
jgi:hypothetical protein